MEASRVLEADLSTSVRSSSRLLKTQSLVQFCSPIFHSVPTTPTLTHTSCHQNSDRNDTHARTAESPVWLFAMLKSAFVTSAVPLVLSRPQRQAARVTCKQHGPQTAPVAPVKIAYEVHGSGPTKVLLVPGMCVNRSMWKNQIREFGKHPELYQLVALDNRGTGFSDIPPAGAFDSRNANYSLETLAQDAWTVANQVFGPKAKVHVAGWSMGSMVAQRIALQCSERVASLCLMSGSAGGWLWSNVPTLELALAAFDLIRCGFDVDAMAEISLRLHFTRAFLAEMVLDEASSEKRLRHDEYAERYRNGIRRDADRDANGAAFHGHLSAVRGHNLTREEAKRLAAADFDTLVLYGEEDKVIPPNASRNLAMRIGAEHRAVPGAHFIIDEASSEVNYALQALWQTSRVPVGTGSLLDESFLIRSIARWGSGPADGPGQALSPA